MDPIPIGSHLFSADALQQAIAQTSTLAADKKGALIGSVDAQGAHVALIVRLGEHVEIQGAVNWTPGNVSGGTKVIASW